MKSIELSPGMKLLPKLVRHRKRTGYNSMKSWLHASHTSYAYQSSSSYNMTVEVAAAEKLNPTSLQYSITNYKKSSGQYLSNTEFLPACRIYQTFIVGLHTTYSLPVKVKISIS